MNHFIYCNYTADIYVCMTNVNIQKYTKMNK